MTNGAITKEVGDFLTRHIDSVAQLEVLLLLYNNGHRQWTPRDVASELRIASDWAAERMKELHANGLLAEESESSYRYAPKSEKLKSVVKAVAQTYAERRVAVIDFIYAKPLSNLRVFAESFRIRKKDDKDG
ncbi:MAG: hypothetical protein ACREV9_04310 [Burkholderiales bacterium]